MTKDDSRSKGKVLQFHRPGAGRSPIESRVFQLSIPERDPIDSIEFHYMEFLSDFPYAKPCGFVLGPTEFLQVAQQIRRLYPTMHGWESAPQLFQLPVFVGTHRGLIILIRPGDAGFFLDRVDITEITPQK